MHVLDDKLLDVIYRVGLLELVDALYQVHFGLQGLLGWLGHKKYFCPGLIICPLFRRPIISVPLINDQSIFASHKIIALFPRIKGARHSFKPRR
jgi:hypothetical protein